MRMAQEEGANKDPALAAELHCDLAGLCGKAFAEVGCFFSSLQRLCRDGQKVCCVHTLGNFLGDDNYQKTAGSPWEWLGC